MSDADILRVPVLDQAMVVGLVEAPTPHLVFASQRHGLVRVRVAPDRGGQFIFSYVIRDDRTGTVTQYQGPHGDPDKDKVVDGPYGFSG